MDKLKKLRGFTLIELILVIIIVSIIVAGSSNLLAQGFKAYAAAKDVINTNSQDIIALERIFPRINWKSTEKSTSYRVFGRFMWTLKIVNYFAFFA